MNMNNVCNTGEYDKDYVHDWSMYKYGSKKNTTLIRLNKTPIATDKAGLMKDGKGCPTED